MFFFSRRSVRRLTVFDRPALVRLYETDPVATVLARVPLDRRRSLTNAVGLFDSDGLRSAAWSTGTLVPFGFDEGGLDDLSAYLGDSGCAASSIVGPQDQVMGLWHRLEPHWGQAREVRETQYSMVFRHASQVTPDPMLRRAEPREAHLVYPAAVAMFTEEVGYDPSGRYYRNRVERLIANKRTFVRMGQSLNGQPRVEFKADVGALAGSVAQIQGVWVAPELRGMGIASACMARVAQIVSREIAPTVSLYVNDYNLPALRVYEKAGFVTVGHFSTVLL